jgi:hypothetical protein
MSHRKSPQADRPAKPAGSKPRSEAPVIPSKPSTRHKIFLAASATLLVVWLTFLVVLAVVSRSKVKSGAPPVGAASVMPHAACSSASLDLLSLHKGDA